MPAHNEEDFLKHAVDEVVTGLAQRDQAFELIICENGSTDATATLATDLAERFPEVRSLSLPHPDYGCALRAGFLAADGDVVVNFDVDYIDLDFLQAALGLFDRKDPPAVVVARKRGPGAHDDRSLGRRLVTATFSLLLRGLFRIGVSDTHGMKVMVRSQLVTIVERCRFGQDLFDTEVILRSERAGLRVAELPVSVQETRPSRTSITRRIPRSLLGLARLRLALWREGLSR